VIKNIPNAIAPAGKTAVHVGTKLKFPKSMMPPLINPIVAVAKSVFVKVVIRLSFNAVSKVTRLDGGGFTPIGVNTTFFANA